MIDARRPARWHSLLTVGVALLVILADQLTKTFIVDTLGPNGERTLIEIVPGLLRLIYLRNTGAAFGIFQGRSPILLVLAIGVVAFLLIYFRQSIAANRWLAIALGLQIGGAIGNIVDRLRYGYVVDFINVPHWPTFNVADSAITVGVVILAVTLVFNGGETSSGDDEPVREPRGRGEVTEQSSNP